MTAPKKKTQTPLGQAQASLAEREGVVNAQEQELAEVRERNAGHTVKRNSGALNYDALAHIQDEHQERALERFLEAQRPHVEVERQAVDSYTLAEALGDHAGQREALRSKHAETERKIREALDEYTEAVTAYNGELTESMGAARRAGLIDGEADPTLPVLTGGGTHGHSRRLVIDGEPFTVLSTNTDSLVRTFLRPESNSIGGSY